MIQNDFNNLLQKAKKGDIVAQEKIINLYQNRIAGFIYSMIGTAEELEDIAQNIFIKMIFNLSNLRKIEQFEPWLFRIARNACMDFLRKKKLMKIFTVFLPEHDEFPEKAENLPEQAEWLIQALQKLPPKERELILLKQDKDYSYEELAQITGSTISSVKSRLFRARKILLERRENEFGKRSMGAVTGDSLPAVEA